METDAPSGGGDFGGQGTGATPGFSGDSGFPGQPGMFGDAGFIGQPGVDGQPGMFPQPGFGGQWSTWRGRRPLTGPGLVVGLIALVIFVIIAITMFSHMGSSGFGTPGPAGQCIGGPEGTGQSIGNGNYRFDCAGGGSTVVHIGNS